MPAQPAPKADPPKCDVPGCAFPADRSTDGTEQDTAVQRVEPFLDSNGKVAFDKPLNRPAIAKLNICGGHINWPHSEDAREWAAKNDRLLKGR